MLESENKKTFKDKLRDKYRLIILNNDTFEEVGAYQLSVLNLYTFISSIIIILSILIILFIVATPIKKFIPGYGLVQNNSVIIEINKELDGIEKTMKAQELYLTSFKKMILTDELDTLKDLSDPNKINTVIENSISNGQISLKNDRSANYPRTNNSFTQPIETKDLKVIPPLTGIVSAEFSSESDHFGTDILAPENTPIKTIADGYVILSGWNLETGNTIGIQHKNDMISFYKHNSALLKKEGNFVKAGEAIAIIGNTGRLTNGPHLHFELWIAGKPVNAEHYISFK